MARPRKFTRIENRLGDKLAYLLCGLLNRFGEARTAKLLGVSRVTLETELALLGIEKRWVVLNDPMRALVNLETEALEAMERGDADGHIGRRAEADI